MVDKSAYNLVEKQRDNKFAIIRCSFSNLRRCEYFDRVAGGSNGAPQVIPYLTTTNYFLILIYLFIYLAIRYGKTVKRRDKSTINPGNLNADREVSELESTNFQRLKQQPARSGSSNEDRKITTDNFGSSRANFQEISSKRQLFNSSHNSGLILDSVGDNEHPWVEQRQQSEQSSNLIKHFNLPANDNCSVLNRQNVLDQPNQKKTSVISFETDGHITSVAQLSPTIMANSKVTTNQQEQNSDNTTHRGNEFTGGTITCKNNETNLRHQSQNLRDNVLTNEAQCDISSMNSMPTGIKLEPTYTNQITSQNRVVDSEANVLAAIASDVGTESLKQAENRQAITSSLSNSTDANYTPKDVLIGPINHLDELYQFEQDYFYQVGGLTNEKISTGATSDIGSIDEPRCKARTNDDLMPLEEAIIKEHNGVVRNNMVNEQTSVIAKQSTSNVNNTNHNTIHPNNTGNSLLKQLSQEDESLRRLSNESRKEETCQGYGNNQHETDDRLKQLSLRFSADAIKKSRPSSLVDNGDRASFVDDKAAQSRTSSFQDGRGPLKVKALSDDCLQADIASPNGDSNDIGVIDIYNFDLNTPKVKENHGMIVENYHEGPASPNSTPASDPTPLQQNITDMSNENVEQLFNFELPICLSDNELTELIEKISAAHHSTCSFLKTKTIEICKRQSISSLPTFAGSQYNRYRQSPSMTVSKQRSDNSPTSSLLHGSAGSSASSVSSASSSGGGSPMNSSQYITSPPTLSPNSNTLSTSVASTSARNHRMTSYLDVSNHHQQQQQQHLTAPINNDLKLSSDTTDVKQSQSSEELSNSSLTTIGTLEEYKISLWQEYALLINPSIKQVVEFAKQVPGFLALNQLDQLLLIKSGFFEIWLVTIAGMFNCADNTLTFSDGTYIDRQQLDTMFDKNFSTIAFNFSISFNQLCLDDTEIGLVSAIILLQPSKYISFSVPSLP